MIKVFVIRLRRLNQGHSPGVIEGPSGVNYCVLPLATGQDIRVSCVVREGESWGKKEVAGGVNV